MIISYSNQSNYLSAVINFYLNQWSYVVNMFLHTQRKQRLYQKPSKYDKTGDKLVTDESLLIAIHVVRPRGLSKTRSSY